MFFSSCLVSSLQSQIIRLSYCQSDSNCRSFVVFLVNYSLCMAGIPESLHLQCVEHGYLLQQDAGMDVHEFGCALNPHEESNCVDTSSAAVQSSFSL